MGEMMGFNGKWWGSYGEMVEKSRRSDRELMGK